jgi:hypothetical protein
MRRLLFLFLLCVISRFGQTNAKPGNLNITGTANLGGQTNATAVKPLNTDFYAGQYPGTECGARATAALLAAGANGRVIVDRTCLAGGGWTTSIVDAVNGQTLYFANGIYACSLAGTGGASGYCRVQLPFGWTLGQSEQGATIQVQNKIRGAIQVQCINGGATGQSGGVQFITLDGLNTAQVAIDSGGSSATNVCTRVIIEHVSGRNFLNHCLNSGGFTTGWDVGFNHWDNCLDGMLSGPNGSSWQIHDNFARWNKSNGFDNNAVDNRLQRNLARFNGRDMGGSGASALGMMVIVAVARNGSNVATYTVARTSADLPNSISPPGAVIDPGVSLLMPVGWNTSTTLNITGLSTTEFNTNSCAIISITASAFSCTVPGGAVSTTPDYGFASSGCNIDQDGFNSFSNGPSTGNVDGDKFNDNVSEDNNEWGFRFDTTGTGSGVNLQANGNVALRNGKCSSAGRGDGFIARAQGTSSLTVALTGNVSSNNTGNGYREFSGGKPTLYRIDWGGNSGVGNGGNIREEQDRKGK